MPLRSFSSEPGKVEQREEGENGAREGSGMREEEWRARVGPREGGMQVSPISLSITRDPRGHRLNNIQKQHRYISILN